MQRGQGERAGILRLWRETVIRVAAGYPDVELTHLYIDNAAMQLVRNPKQFDVILASNIFGTYSRTRRPRSPINRNAGVRLARRRAVEAYDGTRLGARYRGERIANPLATILSAAMLLRHSLNEGKAADAVETAVEKCWWTGCAPPTYTPKGAKIGTAEMGDAVAEAV